MRAIVLKGCAFVLLLGGFWFLGGFKSPDVNYSEIGRAVGHVRKAWLMTVLLFVAGAVMLVWADDVADYFASEMPPAGLRIIGAMLAIAGALWLTMLKESLK